MTAKTRKQSKAKQQTPNATAGTPPAAPGERLKAYEAPHKAYKRKEAQANSKAGPIIVGVVLLALLIGTLLYLLLWNNQGASVPRSEAGRIMFLRRDLEDGSTNLYVVNPDGQGQVQATRDLQIEGSWSWSPDGRSVVAQIGQAGQSEIAVLTIEPDNRASQVVSLTGDVNADAAFPAWSPDGTRITFQHKGEGGFQVYVMDADGKNKRKMSGGTGYAGLPMWSPDGKQIVFIAGGAPDIGTPKELYVADVDGPDASPRQITSFGKDISRPSWSPDGKQIAYIERQGDRAGTVMLVGLDGQNPRAIGSSASNSTPQFSRDGSRILFYNVAPPDGSDIYTAPTAGGEPTNITTGSGEDYVPTWSPDGLKLAWSSIQRGHQGHKIVVANPDGSGLQVVSSGEGDDFAPQWGVAAK